MSISFVTPWTVTFQLLCPWDFPDKDTEVVCHFLFQGIFPTQRINPRLLHHLRWQTDSLPLSHQEALKSIIYNKVYVLKKKKNKCLLLLYLKIIFLPGLKSKFGISFKLVGQPTPTPPPPIQKKTHNYVLKHECLHQHHFKSKRILLAPTRVTANIIYREKTEA